MYEIAVIVTTKHRGVFFGWVAEDKIRESTLTLTDCRNCIYWKGPHGFLRLAAAGPVSGDRIGSRADRVTIHDVTSVAECSQEAADAWDRI